MPDEKTVPDVETDKQILIARLLSSHVYDYNRGTAREILDSIGLAEYLPAQSRPYTVELSTLLSELPRKAQIYLDAASGTSDRYEVGSAVERALLEQVQTLCAPFYNGEMVPEPIAVESRAVDADAVIRDWGSIRTPYPKAGTEEVEEFRRQLVIDVLKFGIERRLCSELEDAIDSIGLSAYRPARTKEVTVRVPGFGDVTTTVDLTRTGEVDQLVLKQAAIDTIATRVRRMDDLEVRAA